MRSQATRALGHAAHAASTHTEVEATDIGYSSETSVSWPDFAWLVDGTIEELERHQGTRAANH